MARFVAVVMAATFLIIPYAHAIKFQSGMNPDFLGGSFHQTCNQCKVYPNGLVCQCLNRYQIPISTRVNLTFCANAASISNQDGHLQCDPINRGSWGQTCGTAHIGGDSVFALCKTRGGASNSTQLNLLGCPSLKLENIDGNLQCMQ